MSIPPAAVGFGCHQPQVCFYVPHRPDFGDYPQLAELRPLMAGEIEHIVTNTNNHWRKLFNVYAKLMFEWLGLRGCTDLPASWQAYRDNHLFQASGHEALIFSLPHVQSRPQAGNLNAPNTAHLGQPVFHIIAGKTYGAALAPPGLNWLDAHLAVNTHERLARARIIVAPYPDYRQLTNARITQVCRLLLQLEADFSQAVFRTNAGRKAATPQGYNGNF